MTDIKRMSEDFEYFCEVIFGERLRDWQKDVMQRLANGETVITKMIVREDIEGVKGTSFDCIIVDDFYDYKPETTCAALGEKKDG
jgi:hypothetical protein